MSLFIKKYIPILLLLLTAGNVMAQKKDSLLKAAGSNINDTNKAKAINALSWNYIEEDLLDSAMLYASKAVEFSKKIGYKKGEASGFQKMAIVEFYNANYNKSIEYYKKSYAICKEINDKIGILASLSNMGVLYQNMEDYPKALECALEALKIREKANDKEGIASSYNNLGLIYKEQKEYKKALDYYSKALGINKELHDTIKEGNSYNNIGIVYDLMKDYNAALSYHFKSLEIEKKYGRKKQMGYSYNNIGMVYFNQDKLDKALESFNLALSYNRLTRDTSTYTDILINISSIHNKKGNYQLGITYADSVAIIAKAHGLTDNLRLAYENLAKAHAQLNEYKKAYEYHVLFKELTDTIFNQQNSELLSDLKTNFEVEKKEAEVKAAAKAEKEKLQEKAELEKQKRNLIILAIVFVLLIVSLFSFWLYKRFQVIKKQNIIIEKQKNEVHEKNIIIEEKQKEISDSINYAKRIQNSFMASEKEFKKFTNDYSILFKPKDVVSGDFYWSYYHNDKFYLCVADSTGHGIPGAFMSLLNMSLLNEALFSKDLSVPNEILDFVRKILIIGLKQDESGQGGNDGMDCSFICIDRKTDKLIFSGANNPIWILRQDNMLELKADKMPVGRSPNQDTPFTSQEFILEKNDHIYLFTDGFADQFGGPKGKKFKYKQLEENLKVKSFNSEADKLKKLSDIFDSWKGSLEQVDDVLVVGLKY